MQAEIIGCLCRVSLLEEGVCELSRADLIYTNQVIVDKAASRLIDHTILDEVW